MSLFLLWISYDMAISEQRADRKSIQVSFNVIESIYRESYMHVESMHTPSLVNDTAIIEQLSRRQSLLPIFRHRWAYFLLVETLDSSENSQAKYPVDFIRRRHNANAFLYIG